MPSRGRGRRERPRPGLVQAPAQVVSGRAWVRGQLQPVEVGIDDEGRILRVARSILGGRRLDVGESLILPAATDLHVHLREPGGAKSVEGFRSGTEAAALGGVATVADMPNTEPPVNSVERVEEKASRARGQLAVDVVLYAAVTRAGRLPSLANAAGAFKLYLSPTSGGLEAPGSAEIRELTEAVAATRLALTVHAEDPSAFDPTVRPSSLEEWDRARPSRAELQGVRSLLPTPAPLRLHVAHVTIPEVVDLLREAGHCFEATPHHLLLSASGSSDTARKVNPPLRTEPERAALWDAFRAGRIPVLASDHAPHASDDKGRRFEDAPSGTPGVETALPLLLEKVRAGDLPLDVLLRTACDRPSRWLGLPQGRLAPGDRAHLLIVDFRDRREIRADRLRTACGWSAFEGWPAIFPRMHLRYGERIVEDGSFVGRASGQVLRPDYATSQPSSG